MIEWTENGPYLNYYSSGCETLEFYVEIIGSKDYSEKLKGSYTCSDNYSLQCYNEENCYSVYIMVNDSPYYNFDYNMYWNPDTENKISLDLNFVDGGSFSVLFDINTY